MRISQMSVNKKGPQAGAFVCLLHQSLPDQNHG